MTVIESSIEHPLLRETMGFMERLDVKPSGIFKENTLLLQVGLAAREMLRRMPAKVAYNLIVGQVGMVARLGVEHDELRSALPSPLAIGQKVDGKASREGVDMYWFIAMAEILRLLEGRGSDDVHEYVQACLYDLRKLAENHPGFSPGSYVNKKLETNQRNYVSKLYAVKSVWELDQMAHSSESSDGVLRNLRECWEDRVLPSGISMALNRREANIPRIYNTVRGASHAYHCVYEVVENIYN